MKVYSFNESNMRPDRAFFEDNDVVSLAKRLLGCTLFTKFGETITAGRIVETEAYRGRDDKACHAFGYKRTKRTETMFLAGGHTYVYLCYGIHHLFNIVTSKAGEPDAVLIRSVEPSEGIEEMMKRRKFNYLKPQLTAGPGVLSKALGLSIEMNAIDLTDASSPIGLILNDPVPDSGILVGPRIGIDYAGDCANWPWRFCIKNNDYLSR